MPHFIKQKTERMKKTITANEYMMLNALIDMRNQYCWKQWHYCMSAWEQCYDILEDYWLIISEFDEVNIDLFYNTYQIDGSWYTCPSTVTLEESKIDNRNYTIYNNDEENKW